MCRVHCKLSARVRSDMFLCIGRKYLQDLRPHKRYGACGLSTIGLVGRVTYRTGNCFRYTEIDTIRIDNRCSIRYGCFWRRFSVFEGSVKKKKWGARRYL